MTNNEKSERARLYEVSFQIAPTLGEDGARGEAENIKSLIQKQNGEIVSAGEPRQVRLAYTIRKETEGKYQKYDTAFFGFFKFEAEPEALTGLNEELARNGSVIRHLVVQTVPDSEKTTAKLAAELREADKKRRDESREGSEEVAAEKPAEASPEAAAAAVPEAVTEAIKEDAKAGRAED
jgi:ribosomal protein S6